MRNVRVCLTACLSLIVAMGPAVDASAQDQPIGSLIREASKECRTAKLLRRDNLEEAQRHFKNYVEILNEVLEIRPNLLDSPPPDAKRVLEFCNVVKEDLDRAEALPLFEQGLRECGEARVMIANAQFDEARKQYRRYREYKDGALAISQSVLDVYENSYEVRLCDRLPEDIAQAEEEYQKQLRLAAQKTRSLYQNVLDSLNQADRQCRGAQNLINDKDRYNQQTISQVEALAAEVEELKAAALEERSALKKQGTNLDESTSEKIQTALEGVNECLASIPAGITRVKTTIAARAGSDSGGGGTKAAQKKASSDLRQIVGAPAQYPTRAVRREIEGHVVVSFTVTKTGDVADIKVLESEPEDIFDQAVIDAVEKYKFQPRIVNGEPVDTKDVQKKVIFKLK